MLLSNWYYGQVYRSQIEENVLLYNKLDDWGYEQIPTTSTWEYYLNARQTMNYCRDTLNPERLKGYLMAPWISGGGALKNYLPKMWEIEFKNADDMKTIGEQISKNARFLTHATARNSSTSAGWKMILMSSFILILTLGAIGICISYIARNTAMLHRRELEILNQIGASDNFIAHQMQLIVAKISIIATAIGFVAAAPILLLIISTAHSARVGLMAMLGLSGTGWFTLFMLPVAIVIFSIWTTRRTTIKILQNA